MSRRPRTAFPLLDGRSLWLASREDPNLASLAARFGVGQDTVEEMARAHGWLVAPTTAEDGAPAVFIIASGKRPSRRRNTPARTMMPPATPHCALMDEADPEGLSAAAAAARLWSALEARGEGVVEVPLGNGVRADLLWVGERSLWGTEIKGPDDSVRRMSAQAGRLAAACDRCAALVSPVHLDEVLGALPDWWGVALLEAGADGRGWSAQWMREPRSNPGACDPLVLAHTLKGSEMRSAAAERSLVPRPEKAYVRDLAEALASLPPDELKGIVGRALLARRAGYRASGKLIRWPRTRADGG
jgi:hypothetical protein